MQIIKVLTALIIVLIVISTKVFAQEEKGETPESIIQRDMFIRDRRAGGPGKTIPANAYSLAMEQKKSIADARQLTSSPFSLIGWVSVNPNGMFYNRTGANYISGRTNGIAFHPSDVNIMYIASAQGGVWKTTNGGTNWTCMTDALSSIAGGDVIVDPANPNIVYFGTGEHNFSLDSQYGDGIFKSTDAGVNWTKVATTGQVGSYISDFAIDPTDTQILFAAGSSGLFKTTNSGTNWTNTSVGSDVMSVIIDPTNTQVIYASTGGYYAGSVSKSTNGGTSWTVITSGMPASNKGRIQLAMAPSDNLIIYASIASSATYALLALSKTTNGGTSWTTMATSPNPLGSQGWYDNSITVKPSDANVVVVAGIDVYVSTNGGTTLTQKSSWSTTSTGNFSHADVHRLDYNGSVMYCGSDGGFFKTTNDGNNWTDLNSTISTLQFQGADYDPTNVLKMYGGCQDNDKETSTDGGSTWIQRATGDGGYTLVDPVNTNYIYSQYVNGTLHRSNNSGVSFSSIAPSGSTGGLFYNPFEMAPGDHNTMIYCEGDVWKHTSVQTATTGSWTQIATTGTVGGSVSAIGISPLTTNKIYIGTSGGKVLVTTNNGSAWSSATGYPYITDFVVDNVDDNICYMSCGGTGSNQVYKTTNAGGSWTNISSGLPNIAANSLILRTTGTKLLVVGMDAGVYYTSNSGTNWIGMNTNLPNVEVYDLKYHETAGLFMAATHGRGVWTFSDDPMPVVMAYFEYEINRNNVILKWATQQEINNSGFEVQRKIYNDMSSDWKKIGYVAGSGNTMETKYYSFNDEKLQTSVYNYRIKQLDYNGNIEYFQLSGNVSIGPPVKADVSQNYPNPFNPVTKIDYTLPVDGNVQLKIYDITGREVVSLINEYKSAGYYTIEFDATKFASGVYFYKMTSGDFVKVKRMLVVK